MIAIDLKNIFDLLRSFFNYIQYSALINSLTKIYDILNEMLKFKGHRGSSMKGMQLPSVFFFFFCQSVVSVFIEMTSKW